MTRIKQIIAIIQDHQEDLESVGAIHLYVFGSRVRGDHTASSDLDVLIDPAPGTTLFDLEKMQKFLEDLLGVEVDLGTNLSTAAQRQFETEKLQVF